MRGVKVTDEEVQEWRRLRQEEKLTYAEIAARSPLKRCISIISKHIGDGEIVERKRGRKPADPELLEACGGDMTEYRRRRERQRSAIRNPERKDRKDQASSLNWKIENKKKARDYDEDRKWDARWKAAGSPPPRNGRPCSCEVPLLDDDSLCDWCGCFRPPPQTSITSTTTSPLPSSDIHWPIGLRQERERGNLVDHQARME